MRARRCRRLLAVGVVAIAIVGLGTRATPVSAQSTPNLWGIDSCSEAQSVVPGTQTDMGNPQFMGRYLGTVNRCAMDSAEVSYLSSQNIYVALLYSPDQEFANGTGTSEAQAAIGLAQSLGAPPGTAIFRDVEAGSPITSQYIEDWCQAFASSASGYIAGFYENPYSGSGAFAGQYCGAVAAIPAIGTSAVLWSSEPEPNQGSPIEEDEPTWNPSEPGCANTTVAWQYLEQGGFPPGTSWPNVDVDEFDTTYDNLLWNGPKGPGAYTALQPYRICDTRPTTVTGYSTECSGNPITQGATLDAQITGVNGSAGQAVPSTARSVVLNVTAIGSTGTTYLTVFPVGGPPPNTSNINVTAGINEANLVVVALGAGGQVGIYNSAGTINAAVDVEGYFAPPSGSSDIPGLFHPIAPLRICDTRSASVTGYSTECSGDSLGQGQWEKVVVSGCPTGNPSCAGSVPTKDVTSAVLNLTGVTGTASTFLSVVPPNSSDLCPTGAPGFSSLNIAARANLPNRVIVPLGPANDVCVYNSAGTINFILDVNGWFGNGSESSPGALFYVVAPMRICDTRSTAVTGYSTECSGKTLGQAATLAIPVDGVDGLPPSGGSSPPVAVIANVTAVSGTANTYFTLYPANVTQPLASDLNVGPGQITANLAIVQLAATGVNAGDVDLFNASGSINAIVDVAGWFQ